MPSGKSKQKNNPKKEEVLEATLLISMFKETIETNAKLTGKMDKICVDLKENTKATNNLLNHLGSIPASVDKMRAAISLIKYGLLPVIVSLVGLIVFFAFKK